MEPLKTGVKNQLYQYHYYWLQLTDVNIIDEAMCFISLKMQT